MLAHHLDGDAYVGQPEPMRRGLEGSDGKTLPEVLHAEEDVINNAYTYQGDLGGWVMYVTRQPCINGRKIDRSCGY